MGLDVSNVHREQSQAAGADDWSRLYFVMLDVGWHVGSPSKRKHRKFQPQANLPRMTGADDQLFRTYKERSHIVRVCGIPVTVRSANVRRRSLPITSILDRSGNSVALIDCTVSWYLPPFRLRSVCLMEKSAQRKNGCCFRGLGQVGTAQSHQESEAEQHRFINSLRPLREM
jgi:hypothetical protein